MGFVVRLWWSIVLIVVYKRFVTYKKQPTTFCLLTGALRWRKSASIKRSRFFFWNIFHELPIPFEGVEISRFIFFVSLPKNNTGFPGTKFHGFS